MWCQINIVIDSSILFIYFFWVVSEAVLILVLVSERSWYQAPEKNHLFATHLSGAQWKYVS